MESLQAFFDQSGKRDIHTLARHIEQYVNQNWERVFRENRDEMIARYDEIGDSVYGIYGARLFRPIHAQLKTVDLRATPRLPGHFTSSREWGAEDQRERWMWSKITSTDGKPFGTIVVAFYHDHLQIRIPRAFRIIALEAITKRDVVKALSHISPDFKAALEAKIEIAQYLAQLAQDGQS